jgi:hypothetical protein
MEAGVYASHFLFRFCCQPPQPRSLLVFEAFVQVY